MDVFIYGTLFLFAAACVGFIVYGIQQTYDRAVEAQGQTVINIVPEPKVEPEPEAVAEQTPEPEPEPEPEEEVASDDLAHEGLYIGEVCPTQPPLFWQYPHPKVYVHDFPSEDRFKHTYILGLTGAGKTTILKHLIPQDLEDQAVAKGVIVMGPDRGLFEYLSACVPPERSKDILYFNPAMVYGEKVIGWNPLDFSEGNDLPEEQWQPLYQQKVSSVFKVLSRTLENVTEPQKELLLESIYGLVSLDQVSLKDFDTLLDPNNSTLRHAIANTPHTEDRTRRFWRDYDNDSSHQASATALRKKFVSLFHEPLVSLFASQAFTWRDLLAHPRIIFIDLSQIGSPSKETVAELILAEIEVEVIRREHSKREKIPYYLYIDEFADFIRAGESTNELFAKARKNWLGFTLAHQVSGQIPANVRAVVEGNAQTNIVLKLSHQDAPAFAKKMQLHLFDEVTYNEVLNRLTDNFYDKRQRQIEERESEVKRLDEEWERAYAMSEKRTFTENMRIYDRIEADRDRVQQKLDILEHAQYNRTEEDDKRWQQWKKEALRAAYDSNVNSEMLMNLQPGLAVVQIPGSFPRGILVQIPLPPERGGKDHLLTDSIQRWGEPRTPVVITSTAEDDACVGTQEEPSATEDFDEQSHEQFLQQKPTRRTRRRD